MRRGQKITFEVTKGRRSIVLFSFVFLLLFFFFFSARSHTSQASLKCAIKLWSWISGPPAPTSWDSRHATMLYVVLTSDPKKEQLGLCTYWENIPRTELHPWLPGPFLFLIFLSSMVLEWCLLYPRQKEDKAVLDCGCLGSSSLRKSVPLSSMTL